MAEHSTLTELAAPSEAREGSPLPQNSIYAAFARMRDITFGKTVASQTTAACSVEVRSKQGLARHVAVSREAGFEPGSAQHLRELAEESNRRSKASWFDQVATKKTAAAEPKVSASPALLRNLSDKELAHHLSQQAADPAQQEAARRLSRLIEQLDEARSSQYQCQKCGDLIHGPL